ncbi:MAG: hypothetical protein KDC24_01620 [Saprospiraceae bacterium]|nr:hypothetical protein [Saprospiraceae bacterium]
MTTRSTYLSLLLVAAISIPTFAQTTERTLVKSFSAVGVTEVHFDMEVPVEVVATNGNLIRVKMLVSLEGGNDKMLKTLVLARRYDLRSKTEENRLVIYAPALERTVKVGGQEVIENIRLEVSVPQDVVVTQKDIPALANEDLPDGMR